MKRRSFLTHSFAAGAVLGSGVLASAQTAPSASAPAPAPKRAPQPQLAPELVREFVTAGHASLPRVKELLAQEPKLINAAWDWGAGDWEHALGAASHLANREIAMHLLGAGARIDAFCAAALGEADLVKSLLRFSPGSAATRGPHGYTLLYHVGYTGLVALAEAVAPHLAADQRAPHFNQALQTAVVRGHTDLTAWFLEHGVDNPNLKNFQDKTPLDVALAKNYDAIAKLLRARGGVTTG